MREIIPITQRQVMVVFGQRAEEAMEEIGPYIDFIGRVTIAHALDVEDLKGERRERERERASECARVH